MLHHSKCRERVYLESSNLVSIKSLVGVDNKLKRLAVMEINVSTKAESEKNPKYICEKCGEIDISEIISFCRRCDRTYSSRELFIPEESGGVYCEECSHRYGEPLKTLADYLEQEVFL